MWIQNSEQEKGGQRGRLGGTRQGKVQESRVGRGVTGGGPRRIRKRWWHERRATPTEKKAPHRQRDKHHGVEKGRRRVTRELEGRRSTFKGSARRKESKGRIPRKKREYLAKNVK